MKLNTKNVNQRDLVLFGEAYDESRYCGGIRRFEGVSYADCQELLNLTVIDPKGRQNNAPTAEEIVGFLKDHPGFTAHGYAVSPKRDDYRVSFEGVECGEGYDLQDVWDFFDVFPYPDEYSVTPEGICCWYD